MLGEAPWYAYLGASADADRALSPSATEPEVSAHSGDAPLREALLAIADVWTLPGMPRPVGRKWHCQHEEWMAAASALAAEALSNDRPEPREWR